MDRPEDLLALTAHAHEVLGKRIIALQERYEGQLARSRAQNAVLARKLQRRIRKASPPDQADSEHLVSGIEQLSGPLAHSRPRAAAPHAAGAYTRRPVILWYSLPRRV